MLEFRSEPAVKVCGITNVDDAMACASLDVELIGLNFSPQSVRCISPAKAAEIMASVRLVFEKTKFAGVFVNQEREFVETLTADLALDAVQLHGAENSNYARSLRAPFIIKAFRVGPRFSPFAAADYDAVLLDSWSANVSGGTGRIFPWAVATEMKPFVRRLFLAGGLKPENVMEAIKAVRPFAVDVCSGIEDAPGRKNHAKLRQFIEAVQNANEVRA